ncbi:MAG: DeoR/GlpR family DNA-binding transcription regulator [Oscillospiraceae bacterium]|nr:DeoR/GlpR family DNA-binding transcription regulator [Oscillospiraceae bacterium]
MKYTRLREMEEYILSKDYVSLNELCAVFDKSMNTIRRDVAELVKDGSVKKLYGGVRTAKPQSGTLVSFTERTIKREKEKQLIGKLAAQLIQDGDIIFLDSGTTTLNIIPHIPPGINVTILTNNLAVINASTGNPGISIIAFGGRLNPDTASFSSRFMDMDFLRSFNVNKAFMAATGVSVESGATNSSQEELPIKKAMVERSNMRILVADATKFGQRALLTYAELSKFNVVVSDKTPGTEVMDFFSEHHISLLVPGGEM